MKWLLILLIMLLPLPLRAEQAEPLIEATIEPAELVPGQEATLRITLLVPSWMPAPPDFPTLDQPDLRIRLPAKSTIATSRVIDGATWSGVSRRYLITPLAPGAYVIGPAQITLRYADPGQSTPLSAILTLPPLTLQAVVPEAAADLDPFIAARALKLEQEVSPALPEAALKPGEGVEILRRARISGAAPMVLPSLLPATALPGFRSYAGLPRTTETAAPDGSLSGQREDSITLMAESAGAGQLPGLSLRWYNLDTGRIETTSLPALDLRAEGPPLRMRMALWGAALARHWPLLLLVALVALALVLVLRRLWPGIRAWRDSRRQAWRAGPVPARRALLRAIDRREYRQTSLALAGWLERQPGLTSRDRQALSQAMTDLGALRFSGRDPRDSDEDRQWRNLRHIVKSSRRRPRVTEGSLAPLNPSASSSVSSPPLRH